MTRLHHGFCLLGLLAIASIAGAPDNEFVEEASTPTAASPDTAEKNEQKLLEQLDGLAHDYANAIEKLAKDQQKYLTKTRQILEGKARSWGTKKVEAELKKIEQLRTQLYQLSH
jgi:hypothetical protein